MNLSGIWRRLTRLEHVFLSAACLWGGLLFLGAALGIELESWKAQKVLTLLFWLSPLALLVLAMQVRRSLWGLAYHRFGHTCWLCRPRGWFHARRAQRPRFRADASATQRQHRSRSLSYELRRPLFVRVGAQTGAPHRTRRAHRAAARQLVPSCFSHPHATVPPTHPCSSGTVRRSTPRSHRPRRANPRLPTLAVDYRCRRLTSA